MRVSRTGSIGTLRASPAGMFRDGLGERRHVVSPTGNDATEMLCLRNELTSVPSFEFALRERVSHLAQFRHAYYGHVRSVDRLNDGQSTLAIVSDYTAGVRLSDLLAFSEQAPLTIDINAALCLIRQIVPAVAVMHASAPQVSHGAMAAERIVVTPNARVVLVEYVLGAALEQLRFSQERYWKDLRVATARVGGLPRFDHRTDVTAIGIVALSLIIGRPLHDDEFPGRLPEVLGSAWAISARGGYEPLPAGLRSWLSRMLQLDARNSFTTVADAQAELDRVLGDSDFLAAPSALESVLAQYHKLLGGSQQPATVEKPEVTLPEAVNQFRAAAPAPAAPAPTVAPPPSAPQLTVVADTVAAPKPRPAAPTSAPQPAAPKAADRDTVLFVSPKEPLSAEEESDDVEEEPPASKRGGMVKWAFAAVAAIGILAAGGFAARKYVAGASEPTTGTVLVTTNPAGAQVFVDGVLRGTAPAMLTVWPGAHTLVVRGQGEPRTIPITITAGAQVQQYLELPKTAAATGQLEVRSEPSGAQVVIDGTSRGAAPLTVPDLAPGEHTVLVESDLGKVEQRVTVTAGSTSSLMVPLTAPKGAPVSGWISVSAPADLQLFESGKLLGNSQMDRLMVSAGSHQIELVNDTLGYRATKNIQVTPGKVSSIKIDFPKGTIALNALPWADVWIDGEKVGETPLGNLSIAIGTHDVLFRHPDFGEQHHSVVVSLNNPARLSVDMRKK